MEKLDQNASVSIADRFKNLVSRGTKGDGPGFVGNQYPTPPSTVALRDFVEAAVFDINDGSFELASVDAFMGVVPLNVTSFKTYLNKLSALLTIAQRPADIPKANYAPKVYTFNDAGNVVVGADTRTEVRISAGPSIANSMFGWVIMIRPNNTLIGSSSIKVESYNAGGDKMFSQTYQVVDQTTGGTVFLWNHDLENNVSIDPTDTVELSAFTSEFDGTFSPEASAFTVVSGPSGINVAPRLRIQGSNATIFVYPVFIDIGMKQLFWEHYVANAMSEFPSTVISSLAPAAGLS